MVDACLGNTHLYTGINLQYLQLELKRVDLRVQQAVKRWQAAGQDLADDFRGLYITQEEACALAERPLASSWGAETLLPTDETDEFKRREQELREQLESLRTEVARGETQTTALLLDILREQFSLSTFEYDAFLICLAPGLDLRYERLYAFLQDDVSKKMPTVGLILDLLLPPGPWRIPYLDCFRDQAPLLEWGLLKASHSADEGAQSLLRRVLSVPPEIVSWLAGNYYPADELSDHLRLLPPQSMTEPLLEDDGDSFTLVSAGFNDTSAQAGQPILAFHGPDERRQLAAALSTAESLGSPLLQADLRLIKADGLLTHSTLRRVLRDAVLTGAIPYFCGWDTLLDEQECAPSPFLREISRFQGPVIISSVLAWRPAGAESGENGQSGKMILRWFIDLPGYPQRIKLWTHALRPAADQPSSVDEAAIELLANQFILTSTQIQAAAQAARQTAYQQRRPISQANLFEAARQQSSHLLDSLAVKIRPRYGWNDIVLPEDALAILKEVTITVRERPLVLDTWGLGQKLVASPGVSALFAGPPGTGKTLAAQVIAEELGMDLYKIDLSSVVSKYIGETEKNLERIFSQARNSNTVLFFDEADAIFGKRSEVKDAHDRYANIEVGYLLQRMESYEGVVILATNLRSNLDDAFIRRLQFIIDFPFPDEAQRLNIWKVLFPSDAPREQDIDFGYLARRFPLSGGNIRNAIVSASFYAASEGAGIATRHLLHGVRRELQKMGRLIDEKELAEAR